MNMALWYGMGYSRPILFGSGWFLLHGAEKRREITNGTIEGMSVSHIDPGPLRLLALDKNVDSIRSHTVLSGDIHHRRLFLSVMELTRHTVNISNVNVVCV